MSDEHLKQVTHTRPDPTTKLPGERKVTNAKSILEIEITLPDNAIIELLRGKKVYTNYLFKQTNEFINILIKPQPREEKE